jgi:hypothetical protein
MLTGNCRFRIRRLRHPDSTSKRSVVDSALAAVQNHTIDRDEILQL